MQNYTKTGVKRIINPFTFQNNFNFYLCIFFLKKCFKVVVFLDAPSDETEIHTHVTLDDFTPHSDLGEILKNIMNACFSFKDLYSCPIEIIKDKDYCPIEIIKGLTDKGQFQYLTKLMGPPEGTYLYATQFHSLR